MALRREACAASLLLLVMAGCESDALPFCDPPTPPPEAVLHAGDNGGVFVLPGGRRLTPTGHQTELGGFPVEVVLHPTAPVAIVNNAGYAWRGVHVVRRSDGMLLQSIERPESFQGMSLAPDGRTLYVAGGDAGLIDVYDVDAVTGMLAARVQIPMADYPTGALASADGTRLWVATVNGGAVNELDTSGFAALRSVQVGCKPFNVFEVPAHRELYVTCLDARAVVVVDRDTFTVVTSIAVPGDFPSGIAARPDGSRVWITVPDGDLVVAVDGATHAIVASQKVGESDMAAEDGTPLPASSPSGITYDPAGDHLLVARSADNAVAILDPATLATQAAIPVGWYPTDVAIAGTFVAVTNGKGVGAGPTRLIGGDNEGKEKMTGTISMFDLADLDLAAATQQVAADITRPDDVFRFECNARDHQYPVPPVQGGQTPIKHVVLIVKENKTYDSVLGDLGSPDADGDPSLEMWDETVTPNVHALAREFTNHDNFYDDGESSVQGHLWLTGGFVTDYIERVSYFEDYRGNPGWSTDPVQDVGQPDFGTFFTHLIKHGVSFDIFGEVTGSLGSAMRPDGTTDRVAEHVSKDYPGIFFNTDIKDEDKAREVIREMQNHGLAQFSYVLLPDDHTNGLSAGAPTPESMISDNDYAVGLLVEAISKLPEWKSTAIFIVQDDTQSGADHVDLHRSLLLVVSPWARRGATSHVHTSYPSLFRSFEHILDVPPLNRYDANATLLYDSWTTHADTTPFHARPRQIPDQTNRQAPRRGRAAEIAAQWSDRIDWSTPDTTPDLGDILWVARFGEAPAGSRLARVVAGEVQDTGPRTFTGAATDDDDDGDADAYRETLERAAALAETDPLWRRLIDGVNGMRPAGAAAKPDGDDDDD